MSQAAKKITKLKYVSLEFMALPIGIYSGMKWCLFVLIYLLTVINLFSQGFPYPMYDQQNLPDLEPEIELDDVEGTAYLNEEFIFGAIHYGGGKKITQIPLRLNIYHDRLEYQDENGKIMAFGNPEFIDYIVMEKEVFVYLRKSKAYKVSGFVKMWHLYLPTLLTKMEVKFLKGEGKKPFDLHESPNQRRLERIPDIHYVMKSRDEIEKVTSVKKLIEYLGTHEDELNEFVENAEISTKEPEKLALLLNFYHQLDQNP